ncbi:MAG: hypothetical protein AAGB19_21430 [Cyanobacteria bacterium P01_F01_bin.3]
MSIETLLMAIAPSPDDKVQLQMLYRTISQEQKDALERTVTKLLPVHESQTTNS